jgi:beta-mannosidase
LYSFYSLCDELGILAWSELIFSDSLSPINDFFLESIEPEVRQNVRRVNRHPSNVQWAGGNEIEGIVMAANTSLANGTHYLDEVRNRSWKANSLIDFCSTVCLHVSGLLARHRAF